MKVASYCRVSTDKEDQANSFETQKRYFREYIQRNPEWELYDIYADEGISGTSTKKRTQFNRMIDDAYEGKYRLIITKEVSRFSRNIVDTISYVRELRAIGVGVMFLSEGINTLDPEAESILSIMALLAQEESRKTSNRVVWGQTRQMERGVVFGRSMLGYDVQDGQLTVNPEGAELVQLIFQMYAMDQMGTAEIARFLEKQGYRTYHGDTKWHASKIIKILRNEKYVGDLVQKKSYTPDYLTHEKQRNTGQVPMIRHENHHEPIISREVWDLAQERLQKHNKHNGSPTGHSNRYIFSGKIQCGECGAHFVGRQKKQSDGTKMRRWCCGKEHCSVGRLVRDDDAVSMLQIALRNLNIDRDALANDVTALVMSAVADDGNPHEKPEHLRHEMDRVQRKKEVLLDSYLEGDISKDDMRAMKQKYEDQLASLQERLDQAQENQNSPQTTKTEIREEITQLLEGERENEVFYKHLLDRLTVFKDRHLELRLSHLPQIFRFL